jgi:predicted ATPase
LRALASALADSRTGTGTTVLVGGEAGSGKTTLTTHFLATAECRVLRSGCDGATTAAPLGPLVEVAEALAVELPADGGAPVDRVRLFAAVRAALVAEPTVWLIEDVHWADAATLDLVRYLSRRGAGSPVMLLLTFRDDEVGVGNPVRVLLGELATVRSVHRLGVPPLSRAAMGELARRSGVDIDVDALCDRTGGNAFYVTEVLAGEDGAVPPTVHDAVLPGRRGSPLPRRTRSPRRRYSRAGRRSTCSRRSPAGRSTRSTSVLRRESSSAVGPRSRSGTS